jgi:hypothetical protein
MIEEDSLQFWRTQKMTIADREIHLAHLISSAFNNPVANLRLSSKVEWHGEFGV